MGRRSKKEQWCRLRTDPVQHSALIEACLVYRETAMGNFDSLHNYILNNLVNRKCIHDDTRLRCIQNAFDILRALYGFTPVRNMGHRDPPGEVRIHNNIEDATFGRELIDDPFEAPIDLPVDTMWTVANAADFCSRMMSGQLTELDWLMRAARFKVFEKGIYDYDAAMAAIGIVKQCAWGLELNGSNGIGSKQTPEKSKVLYEITYWLECDLRSADPTELTKTGFDSIKCREPLKVTKHSRIVTEIYERND